MSASRRQPQPCLASDIIKFMLDGARLLTGFHYNLELQVLMTLGKAVEIAQDAELGQHYWFSLSKRHSTDIVSGELCLGFELLDSLAYTQVGKHGSRTWPSQTN